MIPHTPLRATDAARFSHLVRGADLVIFDFDGVIADSEVISLATLCTALKVFGIEMSPDAARRQFLGQSMKSIEAYIDTHGSGDTETFAAVWEADLFARFATELAPVRHALDVVTALDALNKPYCIASSSTHKRIGTALRAMGCTDRFAHIFSAQQVLRGKPAPDLFEFAAKNLGVSPARCLVVEDSPHGVRAAAAAGMRCAGFAGGQHVAGIENEHARLLKDHGADMVLFSYDGISDLLSSDA